MPHSLRLRKCHVLKILYRGNIIKPVNGKRKEKRCYYQEQRIAFPPSENRKARTFSTAIAACGHAVSGNNSVFKSPCDNYTENVQVDISKVTGITPTFNSISDNEKYGQGSATTSTCTASGAKTSVNHDYTAESSYNYYLNIGKAIESDNYLPAGEHMNNATWLSEMLNSAYILLSKMDSDNNIYNVNVATDTSLQEVSDETLLKKAEAKYEADMRKINQKDKKFDTDLAAMDAERNAIKTEMDTLKSVAKENVDRTFKLFS